MRVMGRIMAGLLIVTLAFMGLCRVPAFWILQPWIVRHAILVAPILLPMTAAILTVLWLGLRQPDRE